MDKIVWYTKGSVETATWLATQLEARMATVPQKNFAGLGICWGAAPSDKFKWEDRNFRDLLNDPRKVRPYRNRAKLFEKIAELGIETPRYAAVSEGSSYVNCCNLFGFSTTTGFVATRENSTGATQVRSQEELTAAVADGCSLALSNVFLSEEDRVRVFVVAGNVVACARFVRPNNETLSEMFAERLHGGDEDDTSLVTYQKVLKSALDAGHVSTENRYWTPYTAISLAARTAATNVCQALEFDLAAVDIVHGAGGTPTIVNVVTTPNLRDVSCIQQPIMTAILSWISERSMSPKEILKNLVENLSDDDEAGAVLAEFRKIKEQLAASGG